MLHEGNPDTTNIKSHFKYNHDVPVPIKAEEASLQPEQQQHDGPMANGASTETVEPAFVDDDSAPAVTHDTQPATVEETNASEMLPGVSEAAVEDTEMQGAP
jgi:hypothetical protein